MPNRDLDEALGLHAALMQAIVVHPGGRHDPEAMDHISRLCASLIAAANDLDARVMTRGIESLARLFFSADGHAGIEAGSLRGVDAIKFQLFNALSNLRGRLQALERRPPSAPELPALEAKKRARVLIVEDNRDSAESLRRLLELCGYTVAVAYTGREGLDAAIHSPPDIVLCDIGLPDSDGYQLASDLRADPRTAAARLIAVTAYKSDEDRRRAQQAGFDLHLGKPVSPEALLNELDKPRRKKGGAK